MTKNEFDRADDSQREPGVIHRVFAGRRPHTDNATCDVFIHGNGWEQAFGGLVLKGDLFERFQEGLCSTFGVQGVSALEGKKCYALRCWGFNHDHIEGIESRDTGKVFTITGFRRDCDVSFQSPLENRRRQLQEEVKSLTRRIHEVEYQIRTLEEAYIDWSNHPCAITGSQEE